MPFYEFKCDKCGDIEFNLRMSEIPLKECPKCGSVKIVRVFKPVPSIWKCSGAFGKNNKN